jgi:HEAT repeat protein
VKARGGLTIWLIVGLAGGLLSCAPAYDVQTLYSKLQSNDSEERQDAEEKLEKIVREGRYEVFQRGAESQVKTHRAPSIVYLSRMQQPEARAALRDLLRVEKRSMIPYNPIRMKATTEESDSRVLVAHLIALNGGDPGAVDLLVHGMEGQPPDVIASTCYALGALRDPKGVPFLSKFAGGREIEVTRAAAQALGMFHTREALDELKTLLTHPSEEVRSEVLSALQLQDDPSVMALLETMASSDPSTELRSAAMSQLSRFKDPSPVPFLIEQLKTKDEANRQVALDSLRQMSGQTYGVRPDQWSRWYQASRKPSPTGR